MQSFAMPLLYVLNSSIDQRDGNVGSNCNGFETIYEPAEPRLHNLTILMTRKVDFV